MKILGSPIALLLLLAACATHQPEGQTSPAEDEPVREGAFVISRRDFHERTGSVLSALEGRVPNLRIQRRSGECPQLTLRSSVMYQSVTNPHVYVDGARATDTCILESLRVEDVEWVEIYPMGVTTRSGYATHAHGLILVFTRTP